MTLRSFSRSRMIVAVISVIVTLTACGTGTTKTNLTSPQRPTTTSQTAQSTVAVPVAPIIQNDQMPPDPLCNLITEEDATNALGFDPGRAHIDTSQVFFLNERACVWGDPKSYNTTPVVDISAKEFNSTKAAQTAFDKYRAHEHTVFIDPNMVLDADVGYGAVVLPTAGAASSIVSSKQWIVTILFVRKDRTSKQAQDLVTELARVVVNNLP